MTACDAVLALHDDLEDALVMGHISWADGERLIGEVQKLLDAHAAVAVNSILLDLAKVRRHALH